MATFYPLDIDLVLGCIGNYKPVVFLDTASAHSYCRNSYLFIEPLDQLTAETLSDVDFFLKELNRLSSRWWLAGYICYEAAYALEPKFAKISRESFSKPLAWMGVFEKPYIFDHFCAKWNTPLPINKGASTPSFLKQKLPAIKMIPAIDFSTFSKAIASIKHYIAEGHSYQANFTYDILMHTEASELQLYRMLRSRQKVSFGAFINDGRRTICCFSPELFFRSNRRKIWVQPMKGTSPRGRFEQEDNFMKKSLLQSEKEKAENVMIVDLLRNDLAKICREGTVKVCKLFQLEQHETLFQMTSSITGLLRSGVGPGEILSGLFPSGSVTGAPKIRTMEILWNLEKSERGVYCGAIGYCAPKAKAAFCVPIRTLQKKCEEKAWHYRVGSGIVWDSKASSEWKECSTKCSFILKQQPEFEIFESILFDKKFRMLAGHISRLHSSARYFGFTFDYNSLVKLLTKIRLKIHRFGPCKVRIFLNRSGVFSWDSSELVPLEQLPSRVLLISNENVDSNNCFLFHKTTYRPWYDKAMKLISKGKCFDMAFVNQKGEVTEGARSNIFVKTADKFSTPLLECGLLNGVLRRKMISDGKCYQKIIRLSELCRAKEVYCGNSVLGLVRVNVIKEL